MAEKRKPFANMLNGTALFIFGRGGADDFGEVFNVTSSRGITKSIWEITLKAVLHEHTKRLRNQHPKRQIAISFICCGIEMLLVCDMSRSFLVKVHQHNPGPLSSITE